MTYGLTDGRTDRSQNGLLNEPTDRRMDGRTDRPSYRDARTNLKRSDVSFFIPSKTCISAPAQMRAASMVPPDYLFLTTLKLVDSKVSLSYMQRFGPCFIDHLVRPTVHQSVPLPVGLSHIHFTGAFCDFCKTAFQCVGKIICSVGNA